MKVLSVYGTDDPKKEKQHVWTWWRDVHSKALPAAMSDGVDYFAVLDRGYKPRDILKPPATDYDLVLSSSLWTKRPGRFIMAMMSDYRRERYMKWIEVMRPQLLLCLQSLPKELVAFGAQRGCKVMFCPWFMGGEGKYRLRPYIAEKEITAMSSGCSNRKVYPSRVAVAKYLEGLRRKDVVLSMGPQYKYPLPYDQYEDTLARTRYYLSGGILDSYIPPKYYEAMNFGACLVSFPLQHMGKAGFVPNKTYIKLNSLDDIPKVIGSERWREISYNGWQMVRKRHTVEARATLIKELYHAYKRRGSW